MVIIGLTMMNTIRRSILHFFRKKALSKKTLFSKSVVKKLYHKKVLSKI
jgi:hypothetical protein